MEFGEDSSKKPTLPGAPAPAKREPYSGSSLGGGSGESSGGGGAHTAFPASPASLIAIVTGGSGGMGVAIGAELAARGVGTIVFAQRRAADAAVAAARAAGAAAVHSLALDVSTRAGVQDFFSRFGALGLGGLHFLVNVSGDCPRTPLPEVGEEEMSATFAVNAAGPFWMCQAARPLMWASGGGAIVSIGSVAGEDGAFAASIAYTMAKAALRGMMMQLAKNGFPPEAYAPGAPPRASFPLVRINNVAPGPVDTPMLASMSAADQAKITAATLTDRVTGTAEVAKAVAHLLLDAHNTTGPTMQLSGGIIRR